MGKYVNVVLPDGKTVAVTEEEAVRLSDVARRQTDQEQVQSAIDARNESTFSQPLEKVKTFVEGVADTATAGVYGKVAGAIDEDYGAEMAQRARTNAGTRLAADVATVLAPSGLLGKTAKEVGALTVEGAFNRAGASIGGKTGRVVEGALSGVAGYSAQTNVTGDQLTIEGAIESAGVGSILTLGFGAIADRFTSMGKKAVKQTTELEEFSKHLDSLKSNEKTVQAFDVTPVAYEDARLANDSWQKAQKKAAGDLERAEKKAASTFKQETDKYNKFIYGTTKPQLNGASGSSLTTAIKKTESVLADVEKRWAPRVEEAAETPFDLSDVPGKTTKAAPEGTPVISAEKKAELDAYRARVSQLYKQKGGGWRVDGGRWVPDPSVKADPVGAAEELRKLNDELKQKYPKASGKLSDIPPAPTPHQPSTPIAHSPVELPESLREFAQKHRGSIEKLALSMDDSTKEAFGRLADDLGVERLATPEETVVAVHDKLKATFSTLEKAADMAKKRGEKAASGLMGWMQTFARGAASLAFGRAANSALGGGWMGAIGQVGASNASRSLMKGAESAMESLDTAMVASKDGIRGKVRNLVAKYGERAGRATERLGPVTAYLTQSFPTGKADTETDLGKLAVKRIEEITHAATAGPDALYLAVEQMLGHPGDLGWKVHNQLTNALNFLLSKAPKDPGIDVTMFKSNWTPSRNETIAFAHTIEAVLYPMQALDRALSGDVHPAAIEALWATMPATMSEFGAELAANADKFDDLPIDRASSFSHIFRTPMTPLQQPEVIAQLQGMYLPRPAAPAAQSQSNPGGRPPAVNSRVAGSSVAGLIA